MMTEIQACSIIAHLFSDFKNQTIHQACKHWVQDFQSTLMENSRAGAVIGRCLSFWM